MPTVSVNRDSLFEALQNTYSDVTFDELCFDFGIELDDVTTVEKKVIRKEKHLQKEARQISESESDTIYKIDVPAKRYDLLCLEGIARALRIFKDMEDVPTFHLATISIAKMQKVTVKPETVSIRPFIVAAILRGVSFNQDRYDRFLDLQDKLHQKFCRNLVAIGTHDLDTLQEPFTYEGLPPSAIKFVPLDQTKELTAPDVIDFYKSDLKIKKILGVVESSPLYPVICDSKRTVLGLPPICNGAHSAVTLKTRNVFIECTTTDLTKGKIALNTMVTMFSQYCANMFEIEPVEVTINGKSSVYPDLSLRTIELDVSYINDTIGIDLDPMEICHYLYRMQLPTKVIKHGEDARVCVTVPPTRSDVLHPSDVIEDVAISFGFHNLERTLPKSQTLNKQQTVSHFVDLIRDEIAQAGFTEILSWVLGSNVENVINLQRQDGQKNLKEVNNPPSHESEVCTSAVRSSLIPGILQTMSNNKKTPRPVKIFEVADVVLPEKVDSGTSNEVHLSALYCGQTSGFEVIQGLLDRVMVLAGLQRCGDGEKNGYYIKSSNDLQYLRGQQAHIMAYGRIIGSFGIVLPEVLQPLDIMDQCTTMELNIEALLSS